ncbi:hypothetical protein LB523_10550 [Mesorhizobium sp. ESP-6-4]|nr:hypothetical protein [Mesorhizobium sp. ESP-6-4]MBZ9659485.1 hypothetical protein [Mesorhizobium sp. ESP-6-4]
MDDGKANAGSEAGTEAFGQAERQGAIAVPQTVWWGLQDASKIIKRVFHD